MRHALAWLLLVATLLSSTLAGSAQSGAAASRLVGEVFAGGQQMRYLMLLSDEIGSRLTGSPGARRAEEAMEAEFKRLGLDAVRREPFTMPSSWERGTATAALVSHGGRALTVASYTWTPGTAEPFEGEVVDVGEGRAEDLRREAARLKGNVALVVPVGADLNALIEKFYRTPVLVRELKEAGARAVLYASDKQHTMLYTSPVDFTASARMAALPTLSLASEDVSLLRRLLGQDTRPRVRLDVRNKTGPAFESTNVVAEIKGREQPEEIVLVGAHLDSNDLGPGALDNAAGVAAVVETARAVRALGLKPRRTIRFVLFMGEEEGMIGSLAYVRRHREELDRTIAALIMDIGAGRPQGWFSMGRTDLDAEIGELMQPLRAFGPFVVEHAAFAATDNAPFMAEGVPNLIMLQDETAYLPVHHTIADTADKVEPRDYAAAVATLAATAYAIADRERRFGRRMSAAEVKKMAADTKVEEQWRASDIWP